MKILSMLGYVQLVFKSIVSSWTDVGLCRRSLYLSELSLPSERNYRRLDYVRRCWFANFFPR